MLLLLYSVLTKRKKEHGYSINLLYNKVTATKISLRVLYLFVFVLQHLKVAEKEKQEDEGNDKTKQQHMSRDLHNQMVSKMSDRNDFDQQSVKY